MTVSGSEAGVFAVVVTAVYYLLARAEATRFLWSRLRGRLDRLARCPACSGFWIGAMAAPILRGEVSAPTIALGALGGLVLTPIGTAMLKFSLAYSKVPDDGME